MPPQPSTVSTSQPGSDHESDPSVDSTDPTIAVEPAEGFIHKSLVNGWKIYPQHQMCYIFDAVTPGRQWKRGTKYTDASPWAEYGPAPWPDLTESDDEGILKPYYPRMVE